MLNLDPVFERADLVSLVERAGGKPRRSGKGYACACPLHGGDNDTAFSIYTSDGDDNRPMWHCFTGCQAGGDAITFVQHWQRLEFAEAVEWLANDLRLSKEALGWTPEAIAEHKKFVSRAELLAIAKKFYAANLNSNDAAMAYALGRGFTAGHIKTVGWGYSDGSDALLKHLAASDAGAQLIPLAREIGLIRADGRDFTANANGHTLSPEGWLIYPHAERGKIVYLSARALAKIDKGDKSRNLPGPRQVYWANWPLADALSDDGLVITEGQADAETVRAWGYPALALCGVSLGNADGLVQQLQKRVAGGATLYLGLSNDAAGHKAARTLAERLGPLTRIVDWPKEIGQNKSDANQLLQNGYTAGQFKTLLGDAPAFLDTEITRAEITRDVRQQAETLERLAGLVARLGETERKIYLRAIGQNSRLGIGQRDFEKLVKERMEGDPKSGIEIRANQFYYWGEPLCNFAAWISHELSRDDGQNPPEILYTINGKLNGTGYEFPAVDVPAADFDSLNWISGNWGARPILYIGGGRRHILLRAIKEHSTEKMTRERMYTFTGWHTINGRRVYLTASGAISATGLDTSVRIDLPGNLARYNLPQPLYGGDLHQAIQSTLQFLLVAPLSVTAPLLCAALAAPLTPFKSLNAVVWVYGPTQSKKSSVSHLALSLFGQFVEGRDYKSIKDWTSTASDLEATMFDCKDVPMIIDDYAPQFTDAVESRKQAKTAHYVVRSVGNRSSRGRRRADMTAQKQFIPRGVVLATAEQPLVGQSIVGRMIYVEVDLGAVDVDELTEAQHSLAAYSQTMAAYIQWLADNWERLETELPNRYALAQTLASYPNQERLTDYYSVLTVAGDMFFEWSSGVGAISATEADKLAGSCRAAIGDLLAKQSNRISGQSPVLRFFQALEELLAAGEIVLPDRTNDDYVTPHSALLVGWQELENRQLYLLTGPALERVKEYWARLDERYDTLIDALRRELYQYGFLSSRAPRQFEVKKWINKKWGTTGTQRVLVIDADKVKTEFDIDLLALDEAARVDPDALF